MRVASLDLGSNTFICLILEKKSDGSFEILEDKTQIVRLGEGLQTNKIFSNQALQRAEACFVDFKKIILNHKVDVVKAVATAAARKAKNSESLFNLCKKYEIPVEIISGELEADLTYHGAMFFHQFPGLNLVIDIGGGSTELILGTTPDLAVHSIPIGCVNLTEEFFPSFPVKESQLQVAQNKIFFELNEALQKQFPQNYLEQINKVIAVAGTPTELKRAELGVFDRDKINNSLLSLNELEKKVNLFAGSSVQKIESEYKITKGRSDLILVGTIILSQLLKALGKSELQVSTGGVRYGLAMQLFSKK